MKYLLLVCLISLTFQHGFSECEVDMVTRAEWGARPPKDVEFMAMPVPHIFIHHTAMNNCTDATSCSRMVRGIQNYHMDNNGWEDIGYNFLIGGDDRVYIGRGWDKVGAHTYGFNRISVAFSLMGNYVKDPPPENMLEITRKMIQCAYNDSFVTGDFEIHGHRDGSCTECPGQALYDIIKLWDRFKGGPLPGYICRSG